MDYFDFYLMHAQGMGNYPKFKECRAYETALTFKEEGKIRHFGISFHDRAEVLEQILTEYPQIEVVQIQFNYADFDDPAVQAGKCYEICRKHGKQVIVMEPVRGGSLRIFRMTRRQSLRSFTAAVRLPTRSATRRDSRVL